MIFAPAPLSGRARGYLRRWQDQIDQSSSFSAQAKATRTFELKNNSRNKTFVEIRDKLKAACPGEACCVYCDDNSYERTDHRLPRSLYPSQTFSFENLLPCCAHCNEIKGAKAASIEAGKLIHHTSSPASALPHARSGQAAFLNPRIADYHEYYLIDLLDTFVIVPRPHLSDDDRIATEFTIDVLRLNTREDLVRRRKHAYQRFLSLVADHESSADTLRRTRIKAAINKSANQLVWQEMQRQRARITELNIIEQYLAST